MKLAQRVFDRSDPMRFASASGDRNPMHIDALLARRTQAGAPVVHGMHLLLWALDAAAGCGLPPVAGLAAQFYHFVHLGELVEMEFARQGADRAQLRICVGSSQRARVTMEFGEAVLERPDWAAEPLEPMPTVPEPLQVEFDQMPGRRGRAALAMTEDDAAALFPAACRWLGAGRVRALAATSWLVGMVCPGLYSIYRDLSVGACVGPQAEDFLAFRVSKTDARFRLVEQEICGGGWSGTVRSFVRMPPVGQASMESLAGVVGPSDFAGSVALIVGGSRGLGELTAKLIATGGGRVAVTWQTGREDAERVAREIRMAGGDCETLAYDSRKPAGAQLALLREAPTQAYYFATPAIFRPQAEAYSPERLREFLAVYVEGFWEFVRELQRLQPSATVFYPSSVAVAERPRGMTEYAMAKAAGETLCADLNLALAPMRIVVKRLPRLATDQTASNTAASAESALDTMLPIVLEVQKLSL